ncbi:hypothetical protein GCM10027162_65610 [Streptomyces incanus]
MEFTLDVQQRPGDDTRVKSEKESAERDEERPEANLPHTLRGNP